MTTASVSIVDKANDHGKWTYFDITDAGKTLRRKNAPNSQHGVLDYENRGKIWGLRGLSPGSQKIFTLTEGERVRTGLRKRDVVPCVTTLRHVPRTVKSLSKAAFQKHFIEAGAKCWLIRSYRRNRSQELDAYLESISAKARQNYTCQHQKPWFNFLPHPVPQMLFSSGFTEFGPKVLINGVQARAIGSVWGVHATKTLPVRKLQSFLLKINFEKQVVAHAEKLKKVEVKQLNSVLNAFVKRDHRNGRKSTR